MGPLRHVDRLLVISGINMQNHVTPELLTFHRRDRAAGAPLGAICPSIYMAKAGHLDGMQTAVNWACHDLFLAEFVKVRRGSWPQSDGAAGREPPEYQRSLPPPS